MPDFSRRTFMQTTVAAMAGSMAPLGAARKKIPIGVQLYSVSKQFNGDVPGTLTGIKKIGFDDNHQLLLQFLGPIVAKKVSESQKPRRQILE